MTYNKIEQALRDYHWMTHHVKTLKQQLEYIEPSLTPQYGIESSMPKTNGGNGDKVGKMVVNRSIKKTHLEKLEQKIKLIDGGLQYIHSDLQKSIMLCMMDGLSQFQISQHFKISEGKVSSLKSNIVQQLYEKNNERNEDNKEFFFNQNSIV